MVKGVFTFAQNAVSQHWAHFDHGGYEIMHGLMVQERLRRRVLLSWLSFSSFDLHSLSWQQVMLLVSLDIFITSGANPPINQCTNTTVNFAIAKSKKLRIVLVMDISGSMQVSINILYYIILYYIILYYIILYCIILYCIILYYIILYIL